VVLDGVAHLPALERPEEVARLIGRFIAQVEAGA
jgi:pimeloyl-ACP methyl ester carboxylesterase